MELVHRLWFFIILIFNLSIHVNGSIFSDIISTITSAVEAVTSDSNNELSANTSELITLYGYNASTYQVVTEDGYNLTVSRIVNSGPVVFIMPGLASSADDFCTQGKKSLAFLLADAGYDVYLGNPRGNKYSQGHLTLTTNDKAFWNFSFHEIGYYDVPAIIDFALETSNKTKLSYVGFAQGNTAFYVMASLKPIYNDKVSVVVSMSAIAWLSHQKSILYPILKLLQIQYQYETLSDLGLNSVLEFDTFKIITTKFCPSNKFTMTVCATAIFILFGFDYPQINYTQFPVEISHFPAGASVKLFCHYAQLYESAGFRQFDYELPENNLIAYGTVDPPTYPLEKVTVPVAIMTGQNDPVAAQEDVNILINILPNVILNYTIPYKSYCHTDFMWAENAKEMVYDKVIEVIKSKAENI